jgi:hypothetical protein
VGLNHETDFDERFDVDIFEYQQERFIQLAMSQSQFMNLFVGFGMKLSHLKNSKRELRVFQ